MEITQNKCRLKTLYRIKIHRNCIKIRQNDEVKKDVKYASKIWLRNGTKNNKTSSHMLQDHCYPFGLSLWPSSLKKKFLEEGPPVTYFGPALDLPLGGSGRKTTTLVRDHEYFIPTKFHQNPSSGFAEEVENVKSLRTVDDGRWRRRRRTDGALWQ